MINIELNLDIQYQFNLMFIKKIYFNFILKFLIKLFNLAIIFIISNFLIIYFSSIIIIDIYTILIHFLTYIIFQIFLISFLYLFKAQEQTVNIVYISFDHQQSIIMVLVMVIVLQVNIFVYLPVISFGQKIMIIYLNYLDILVHIYLNNYQQYYLSHPHHKVNFIVTLSFYY